MKVLVTGANGQLVYALQKTKNVFSEKCELELIALTRVEMDLSQPENVSRVLDQFAPDAIINAAAYTAVDKAESEYLLAQKINAEAVQQLAMWCQHNKKILLHVSTDFVFDGEKSSPYKTDDQTRPASAYGKTKQQGEAFALNECANAYVIRTGWVYGEHGANFAKTILRLADERESLGIVSDQIGTPTYATHLAEMLWQLLLLKPQQKIWHFSDAGVASWYDFAVAIAEEGVAAGLLASMPKVEPVTSAEFATAARRPRFSLLDSRATRETLGMSAVHWRANLRRMLTS
ncbi:MAG: dTDP-4-dehydrorhamnose reductase [Moraxellaceae bacterium]|nr:MAG: dTDP-4-dehydrorhamnose reductase [Moraxellaceae bacterium]